MYNAIGMTFTLYVLSANVLKVDKSSYLISQYTTADLYIKENTSLLDLVVSIQLDQTTMSNVVGYANYASLQIGNIVRYYFIRDTQISVTGLATFVMHEDVLFTFATSINAQACVIDRCANSSYYDKYMVDDKAEVRSDKGIYYTRLTPPLGWTETEYNKLRNELLTATDPTSFDWSRYTTARAVVSVFNNAVQFVNGEFTLNIDQRDVFVKWFNESSLGNYLSSLGHFNYGSPLANISLATKYMLSVNVASAVRTDENAYPTSTRTNILDLSGIEAGNIYGLANALNDVTNWGSLFTNKADYINSVRVYPFNPQAIDGNNWTSDDYVQVGDAQYRYMYVGDNVQLNIGYAQYSAIYRGYLKPVTLVNRYNFNNFIKFDNYLDTDSYTKYELYIPYIGYVELSYNDCVNKYISVRYFVDYDSGNATGYVETSPSAESTTYTLVAQKTAQVGVDVPLSVSNSSERTRSLVSAISSLGAGLAIGYLSKDPIKGIATASISGANSIMNANVTTWRNISNAGDLSLFLNPACVFMRVTSPNPVSSSNPKTGDYDDYVAINGLPSGRTVTLSDIGTGYVKVRDVNLSISGATNTETTEILNLLKSGVYL